MILKGRGLSKGKGEAEVVVSNQPVSFLGGVDARTGNIVDANSDVFGESVAGKVFAFPEGKGSTVGSYVIYGLALNGCAPVAILNEESEVVVATGVIIADIPLVDGIDISLLRTGDTIEVDGNEGTVDVKGIEEIHVVTSFLENEGKVLLLKRSDLVGTYQGMWAGVSGYLEGEEKPLERALKEIREEVGIENPELVLKGKPILSRDKKCIWIVHPHLFRSDSRDVELDWEHTEYRWIDPDEISTFETVPRLPKTLGAVIHGIRSSRRNK